jgi:molybdopterin-guanine dinucleotide biosynthesis protein A
LSIEGVVLAGGLSRRMGGGDKSLKLLAGQTILERVLSRAKPQVTSLVLNANGDAARFARFGLPVVADSVTGFAGPLAGVLAGLDWAAKEAKGASYVASFATDAPFFPLDLVKRLEAAVKGSTHDLACAASGGREHPVFGLWPVALREDLRKALADGMRKVVEFSASPYDPFFNVNSPEDLAEAEKISAQVDHPLPDRPSPAPAAPKRR